jgi:hypothetical protein
MASPREDPLPSERHRLRRRLRNAQRLERRVDPDQREAVELPSLDRRIQDGVSTALAEHPDVPFDDIQQLADARFELDTRADG